MFRAIFGLWRWRHNSLRRRSDRVEAWLAVCAALVIAVGAPLVGLVAGDAAHRSLLRTVAQQHEERSQVWATVHRLLPRPAAEPEFEESGDRTGRQRVAVGWTAPDGTVHRAVLGTREGIRVGERFPVWTDRAGQVTSAPMRTDTAATHSALAGLVVAVLAGAAVEAGRRLLLRRLMHRRYEDWERAWARVGPDWGRTDASS
ncbi:hypothetical protein QNO07_15140 [Streptomyces sp. 549]|uniref:Rv1733c family protein n=1 Tax=Streptomyces sp. 549 TaxID=3049076 RepID=UPI0024C2376F|nr:hypothetical protein [Streptomyces sp. 549]MDK1474741.1 hypothetical protein [Streptomyces sp. 549]